jgi:hypothetical protein
MTYPFRINTNSPEERPRCGIRPVAGGFGFCQAARSCDDCAYAKLDRRSPRRIEPGDEVVTPNNGVCTVERLDERRGFLTGYIWIQTKTREVIRMTISGVTLFRKQTSSATA